MKTILCALTATLLVLGPAVPRAQAAVPEAVQPAVRTEILAAIERWKQAVIQKDRATLERIFTDDLSYGHTTGEILGKAETIERNTSPDQTFSGIELTDVAVRAYGNYALVTHKIAFHSVKNGLKSDANLAGLDVWVKKAHGWQLQARQLTKLPQN